MGVQATLGTHVEVKTQGQVQVRVTPSKALFGVGREERLYFPAENSELIPGSFTHKPLDYSSFFFFLSELLAFYFLFLSFLYCIGL